MTNQVRIPNLERITFFNGQQLTAADLAALQRANRELRWLHNRSLHGWGIGIGLAVAGERGSSSVQVGPGYAVDCLGREIILTHDVVKPVPATSGKAGGGEAEFFLIAAYQDDAGQQVAEKRPGVCLPEGTVRLGEEPRLDWREPQNLVEGRELVLAQVWVENCRLSRPVSLAARRLARAGQQPYLAAGQTSAQATPWDPLLSGGQVIGIQTVVDTSAARFRGAPYYFAHVVGNRFLDPPKPGPCIVSGLAAVIHPTPVQFTCQVFLPGAAGSAPFQVNPPAVRDATQIDDIFERLQWRVAWMGVEG